MGELVYSDTLDEEKFRSFIEEELKGQYISPGGFAKRAEKSCKVIIGYNSDIGRFADSLAEAEVEGKKHGLHPYSLTEVMQPVNNPKNMSSIFSGTTSSEVQGTVNGVHVVQIQHGVGRLSTSEGVKKSISEGIEISLSEGRNVGSIETFPDYVPYILPTPLIKESDGIPIFGLEDLRNGKTQHHKNYVVQLENIVLLDHFSELSDVQRIRFKENLPVTHKSESHLTQEEIRTDDLMLARLGGPQNLERYIQNCFYQKYCFSSNKIEHDLENAHKIPTGNPLFLSEYGLFRPRLNGDSAAFYAGT